MAGGEEFDMLRTGLSLMAETERVACGFSALTDHVQGLINSTSIAGNRGTGEECVDALTRLAASADRTAAAPVSAQA